MSGGSGGSVTVADVYSHIQIWKMTSVKLYRVLIFLSYNWSVSLMVNACI